MASAGQNYRLEYDVASYEPGIGFKMNMRISNIAAAAALAGSLLTGCATVPRDSGFSDVEQTVSDRLSQRIQWRQDSSEDRAADEAVAALLANQLDKNSAVQIALLNNRRLQAVYEELGMARAGLVQAGLLRNPVFGASIGFTEGGGSPDLRFSIVQDFLSILYMPLRKRVAESEFAAAKLRVSGAVIDLSGDVGAAYYALQAARQMLELRRQVAGASAASLDAARRLRQAGNITGLDLDNEQALFINARLDVEAAKVVVTTRREHLNRLMGLSGATINWRIADRLPALSTDRLDLKLLEARAVESSLDLAIVRQDIETMGRRLGFTRASALVPELELGAEGEREEGAWDIGPEVAFPIPLFDQGQARIAAARSEVNRLRRIYVALASEIESVARATRKRLVTARRMAGEYERVALPLQARIVEQTQLQYNAMQLGVFQLLASFERQIDVGERYVETLRDYWLARNDLERILNGRTPDTSPIFEGTE